MAFNVRSNFALCNWHIACID